MTAASNYQSHLDKQIQAEKNATELIRATQTLWYEKGIELVLFRKKLFDTKTSEVLSHHDYAEKVVEKPIAIEDTSRFAILLSEMDLCPARMDIGRIVYEWGNEKDNFESEIEFLTNKLSDFIGEDKRENSTPKDVVLYGFGRIGRLLARELIIQEGRGEQLRLRAIVTRDNNPETLEKRASLLRVDSVHGAFPGSVEADVAQNAIVINGRPIYMIGANNPEDVDYTKFGIDNALILDNTGVFTDRAALSRHLKAKGVHKVLLTAPGKEIPNIVHGVNQKAFDPNIEDIFSAASCTTNAIVPILKVVCDKLGLEKGHIETVHAYTNDQNLVDNMHKKYRRGRSAALNMVITETGAGKAAAKALPEVTDKLTSNAIRVPVPNGSLAILNLQVGKETSIEEVNQVMKEAALAGDLVEQINYSISNELVSSDIIGNPCPSVFDSKATLVSPDKKSVVLYVWYDNEYGYSRQVIRLSKYIAQVRRKRYY
ncbi:MAG: glyceraldehyde-3-phosphate dehydrogenase [Cryomorphaceae bacterium]|nr:glyceraldehyde-3-phosphate dehydrogenase [Cryomorphaceae bacterium]